MQEELIFENKRSRVYRSIENEWNRTVLLKVLNYKFPSPPEIIQFYREFDFTSKLNIDSVRKPIKKSKFQGQHCMYLEWIEGKDLRHIIDVIEENKINLKDFLNIAISICKSVIDLHKENIIHKDLKPSNIIIDIATQQARLISFNIATKISLKEQHLGNPEHLSGTLPYLSPEQTGRMNRYVDYRSDLYSLGITFYEMLIGRTPFEAEDALEMVHNHIAVFPKPLIEIDNNIPKPISDIVQILLAKKAEDRYQSAFGLKYDLELCLEQLEKKGTIETFKLRTFDYSGKFSLPQKLYGRENEIEIIKKRFESIALGNLELILLSGYSGTGKSVLVREVYKPITERKGYFIEGKFDQFQRAVPYYAFLQAFNSFINMLLGENAEKLEKVRQKLINSIGDEGKVLTDVLPSLELIIGPQKDIPELGGAETQNRFNYVFRKFVKALSSEEHPIVLFIDDLQWADSSSLNLLENLLTDLDNKYLLCICVFRDNEVSPTHPFIIAVEEIRKVLPNISEIKIGNLSLENINQLIADALNKSKADCLSLASLVHKKTLGNAFFTVQFLKSLYEEELLYFNHDTHEWEYSLATIEQKNITDNVVELMAGKANRLPTDSLDVLKLASCIGSSFDKEILSIILKKEESDIIELLQIPLEEGFILPLEENYKFAHDRIQQAIYSLIPDNKKDELHLQIGQLLLEEIDEEKKEKYLFDITNHLNAGINLIHDKKERLKLCKLNLQSGIKAKETSAFTLSFEYLKSGIELLENDAWKNDYDTTLKLYALAGEIAYLNGDFKKMNDNIKIVLDNATNLLDKVKSYEIRILAYKAENKLLDSINTALEFLEQVGEKFPKNPKMHHVMADLVKTKLKLRGKDNEYLSNLPMMTDENKIAAMRIIADIASSSYWATPTLFPLLMFRMVNLSLKYGNTAISAFAFATYGVIMCGVLGDMKTGNRFGKLGLILLEKFNAKEWKAQIFTPIYGLIVNWNDHIDATLKPLQESYHIGMETGAIEFACVNTNLYCIHSYLSGKRLERLQTEAKAYSQSYSQFKQETNHNYNEVYRQGMLNLMGKSENPLIITGEAYNEEKMMLQNNERNDRTGQFHLHFNKLIISYLLGDYNSATYHASETRKLLEAVLAKFEIPNHHFYEALTMLALYPKANNQRKLMSRANKNIRQMKKWAKDAPQNFQHKHDLILGSKMLVLGKTEEGISLLNQAIKGANQNDFIHEEAIANEILGKFYANTHSNAQAEKYLKAAYNAFREWGAKVKLTQLETNYSQYISDINEERELLENMGERMSASTITISGKSTFLDINSILKTSSIISSEIVLEKLLKTLLKIVMENAGADRGILILEDKSEFLIQAVSNHYGEIEVFQKIDYTSSNLVPKNIISYVIRTQKDLVIQDAQNDSHFVTETYFEGKTVQSVLCLPIINRGDLKGILYLENNLTTNAFTKSRMELLAVLSGQIAVSLNNSMLYENLEQKVAERTQALNEAKEKTEELLSDISIQKKELEKLNVTKDRIFGIIGHDLRKPVIAFRGIAGKINYLLKKEDFVTLKKLGEGIERDALGLNALTDNLLNWALSQKNALPFRPEEIELEHVVDEIFLTLGRLASDKSLELISTIQPKTIIVVDRSSFVTIIRNIVDNAIKFTPENGTITISSCPSDFGLDILIQDTGVGIPQDKINHIFLLQKDKTTEGTSGEKGTGLGLHLVKEMVELNKGNIHVTSREGEGTTFILSFRTV